MEKMTLVQLKANELRELRERWWLEQGEICPILKTKQQLDQMVIDHQHKLKSEDADESGKGICRGSINRYSNALEGKISNNFKRLGLDKHIKLPDFLRNLADYLENNRQHEEVKYIHPKEAKPKQRLKKSAWNKLLKAAKEVNKEKNIPKWSGNFSESLKLLFEKYNIQPEFY